MSALRENTKKRMILEIARGLGVARFTWAELEQIRRQLTAQHGAAGKTSHDTIASLLEHAGFTVVRSHRADTAGRYEEEFRDLLHFSSLGEAEMCLVRLDELRRRFEGAGERAAVERVMEVARLGRRRAEMIARNPRVDSAKRSEKTEILEWFRIWLETPEAFFDWLELRKQSPEFRERFGGGEG
jgi:hypothetical protein